MTYTDTNDEGQSITYYTDGLVFVDNEHNTFPGADVTVGAIGKSNQLYLTEGIWYMPQPYRVCIYTAREVFDTEGFLDINKRVTAPSGYLKLETEFEIKLDTSWSVNSVEYYYDLSFLDETAVFELLAEDLKLYDKGNLYTRYSKIDIIDRVFK